jgi:uncharacterized alkaline shock family protein YloU
MKLVHVLLGFLIYFLVAAGCYVVYGAVGQDVFWEKLFMFLYEQQLVAVGGLVASFLLLVAFALTASRQQGPVEFISYEGEGGAVSISVKAVKDFVEKIGGEFAAVLSAHPALRVCRGGIEIDLDVRVQAGTHLPELCRLLQDRVRDSVRDHLGLSDVRAVRVNVREIVGTAPREDDLEKDALEV